MKPLEMPQIGLGTWKLQGEECEQTIRTALDLGYRHIDTADLYENHAAVGRAIKGYPREQLFLTSKIYVDDMHPARVEKTALRFLDELQVDYLDLLLIHWPNPEADFIETLQAMQALKNRQLVHFIGISNFVRFHLEAIHKQGIQIYTNQIEMHPYLQRRPLVAVCKQQGIKVTAYRPLAKGAFEEDPILQSIGVKYGKKPSQIALKWLLQQGIAVIPKAANPQHLKDNLDLFDFSLDASDMSVIDGLEAGRRYCSPEGMPIYAD